MIIDGDCCVVFECKQDLFDKGNIAYKGQHVCGVVSTVTVKLVSQNPVANWLCVYTRTINYGIMGKCKFENLCLIIRHVRRDNEYFN